MTIYCPICSNPTEVIPCTCGGIATLIARAEKAEQERHVEMKRADGYMGKSDELAARVKALEFQVELVDTAFAHLGMEGAQCCDPDTVESAFDLINKAMEERDQLKAQIGAATIPRRFEDWYQDDDHDVLWWETSMTGGEIREPPQYIGGPDTSDWPFEAEDEPHLLWVPLPKLASGKPAAQDGGK